MTAHRKATSFQVEWKGKKRPLVLTRMRAELRRGLEKKEGRLWRYIRDHALIAGYNKGERADRFRAFRSDGAESLLALLVAAVGCADVRKGFLGAPVEFPVDHQELRLPRAGHNTRDGQRWARKGFDDLAQLAFGSMTPASMKRTQRAWTVAEAAGWAHPITQKRTAEELADGSKKWTSENAIKKLNLDALAQMMGLTRMLAHAREKAKKLAAKRLAEERPLGLRERQQLQREQRHKRQDELDIDFNAQAPVIEAPNSPTPDPPAFKPADPAHVAACIAAGRAILA